MKRFAVTLIVGLALGSALGGCTGGNSSELQVKLAPIHELDVRFAESFPVQVFIYIKGGLSDGCTRFHGIEIKSRSNNNVRVEVTVERPRNATCPAVYTFFEQNLNLGSDFKTGETYSVVVNDKSTSFKMQ